MARKRERGTAPSPASSRSSTAPGPAPAHDNRHTLTRSPASAPQRHPKKTGRRLVAVDIGGCDTAGNATYLSLCGGGGGEGGRGVRRGEVGVVRGWQGASVKRRPRGLPPAAPPGPKEMLKCTSLARMARVEGERGGTSPARLALPLEQHEDVTLADRPLDVAHDRSRRVVEELHAHLRHLTGLASAAEHLRDLGELDGLILRWRGGDTPRTSASRSSPRRRWLLAAGRGL